MNLLGVLTPHDKVPWFWSDQYDLKMIIVGLSQGYDDVVIRGDPASRSFAACYLNDGELIAIDTVNAPKDQMAARKLVAARSAAGSGQALGTRHPAQGLCLGSRCLDLVADPLHRSDESRWSVTGTPAQVATAPLHISQRRGSHELSNAAPVSSCGPWRFQRWRRVSCTPRMRWSAPGTNGFRVLHHEAVQVTSAKGVGSAERMSFTAYGRHFDLNVAPNERIRRGVSSTASSARAAGRCR